MNGKRMQLIAWQRINRGTLRGFATVVLPIGLEICDIAVLQGGARRWASLPAKPVVDNTGQLKRKASGRRAYTAVLTWREPRLREAFSQRVVALVDAHDPAAFEVTP